MELKEQKVMAVREFMIKSFPDSQVSVEDNPGERCQVVSAKLQGVVYTAMVRDEFLERHSAAEIPGILESFFLVEHLKDMPGTPFVVTLEGLQLQYA